VSLHGGSRSHDIRRRMSGGYQQQLAVVAGYSWKPHSGEAFVYLACGMMPSGLLRYSGKTVISFSNDAERHEFAVKVHAMRLARRHPLFASPMPERMIPITPILLAEVRHHGWSEGGLMRDVAIERFRSVDEPPPRKRTGPTIVAET
jgi:hypothetical protein